MIGRKNWQADCPLCAASKFTCDNHFVALDQWKYRGWDISFDMKPIPARNFDWTATGPNYDASYEGPEDGWVATGGQVHAATYEELLAEIDSAILDMEERA